MSQLAGLKCLTVGSTGTGKSTLHQNLAAVYKQPFYRLGGRGDMESDTIIGRVAVKDGETTFQLGEFAKAFRDGYYILLDEQWKLPSSINMTLQRVLEKGGILQIDDMDGDLCDKQIHKHSRTLIELADNVVGTGDGSDKYNATMIQDASTLNRVDLVLEVPYLKSSIEMGMLMRRFPVIPDDQAKKAVQVANLIRQAYDKDQVSATLSPRNLCAWMELAYKSKSYEESFKWTMLSRYADEQEKATVRGFWATVYGEELG
jgi:nitric oxide reductase NorQ protein